MVESQPSKLLVAGPIPVSRSRFEDPEGRKYAMAEPQFQVDRTTALYERPAMNIVDVATFTEVKKAIANVYAPGNVEKFLKSVEHSGMRVRDFEAVLKSGKLGVATASWYATLTNGDQGQIREFYLASVEKVELALRDKYFKVYAYY